MSRSLHQPQIEESASDHAKLSASAVAVTSLPAPSLLLYVAGLCVTLSGLYAVNFGSQDTTFTTLTFGLAICGYLFSYMLRLRKIAAQSLHTPMLIVLGLAVLAMLSSERGLGWLAPQGMEEDRARWLQFIFAWFAIVHSFLLANDAAVLFACVPCMTMLALVSTRNAAPDVQNAFLVFIGASTFMMVHENYLRTRSAQAQGRSRGSNGLFGGQLQLTALCLVGALVLANFVALPIRTIGQTLFESSGLMNPSPHITTIQKNLQGAFANRGEQDKVEIGAGPVAESDAEIMSIKCDVTDMLWRGKTFGTYDGREFINTQTDAFPTVVHSDEDKKGAADPHSSSYSSGDAPSYGDPHRFVIAPGKYELRPNAMTNARTIQQTVTVRAPAMNNLYGAGDIVQAMTTAPELSTYPDGEVHTSERLDQGAQYSVVSLAPAYNSEDASPLQAASSSPNALPQAIRDTYLTTRIWDKNTSSWLDENPNLRAIATKFTQGLHNNYDKAKAIQTAIRSLCQYNLRAKASPKNYDAVEYFLSVSHQGYCTDFAAAMTMLCRYAGVPTRLVRGYLTGELQDGAYIVRDKHYHVWTEVFFPKIGWVPFDATENTVNVTDRVTTQRANSPTFMAWLFSHGGLPPAIGLLVLGLIGYVCKAEILDRLGWRRAAGRMLDRPPTNVAIVAAYLQACDLLRRNGVPRLDSQTPDEYAHVVKERTAAHSTGVGEIMGNLTRLYNQYRYGAGVARDTDVKAATQAVLELKSVMNGIKLQN
jgi:transglutaminase-like putative cysteine protease